MLDKVIVVLLSWSIRSWCLEVGIPERYLRPRHFNPHPYTTSLLRLPATFRLPSQHPYGLFERQSSRGQNGAPVQFPKVPDDANVKGTRQGKLKQGAEQSKYYNVPKNYAFSYRVKDQQSGDDFSHSQAHNGVSTRGEYRVRLPDGRLQVVSYTADSGGYRADVTYEQDGVKETSHTEADSSAQEEGPSYYEGSQFPQDLPQEVHSMPAGPPPQYTPIHEDPDPTPAPPYPSSTLPHRFNGVSEPDIRYVSTLAPPLLDISPTLSPEPHSAYYIQTSSPDPTYRHSYVLLQPSHYSHY